jgi:hypothetical protein
MRMPETTVHLHFVHKLLTGGIADGDAGQRHLDGRPVNTRLSSCQIPRSKPPTPRRFSIRYPAISGGSSRPSFPASARSAISSRPIGVAAASSCNFSGVNFCDIVVPATVAGGDEVGGDTVRRQLEGDVPDK